MCARLPWLQSGYNRKMVLPKGVRNGRGVSVFELAPDAAFGRSEIRILKMIKDEIWTLIATMTTADSHIISKV